jgi:hypothetical protein
MCCCWGLWVLRCAAGSRGTPGEFRGVCLGGRPPACLRRVGSRLPSGELQVLGAGDGVLELGEVGRSADVVELAHQIAGWSPRLARHTTPWFGSKNPGLWSSRGLLSLSSRCASRQINPKSEPEISSKSEIRGPKSEGNPNSEPEIRRDAQSRFPSFPCHSQEWLSAGLDRCPAGRRSAWQRNGREWNSLHSADRARIEAILDAIPTTRSGKRSSFT